MYNLCIRMVQLKKIYNCTRRSVRLFFLKESLFCCFCLKCALVRLLLFFFYFSLRVTLLSIELVVFPLWGLGKQFLTGLTLEIFSLPPFSPLDLHTMFDLACFCHPKEPKDGKDSESQIRVTLNMEIDFGREDIAAYVTYVTHGEDTINSPIA